MKHETELKLQAYLDGESPEAEAREMAAWLDQDEEARMLLAELTNTRQALQGNEPEVRVPETREFYWSKIERAIASEQTVADREERTVPGWWMRILAPVAGLAAVLAVVLLPFNQKPGNIANSNPYRHDIEMPLGNMDIISFHSQEAGMTVVWLASTGN